MLIIVVSGYFASNEVLNVQAIKQAWQLPAASDGQSYQQRGAVTIVIIGFIIQ